MLYYKYQLFKEVLMAGKVKDLTGKRFGRLVVLENIGRKTKSPNVYWKCQCDCGNIKDVRGDYLRNGGTSSCGCFGDENRKKKGRWRERKQVCSICGKPFTYKSPTTPKCCSQECRRKFDSDYVRLRNSSSFEMKLAAQVRGIKHKCKKEKLAYDLSKEFVINKFNEQEGKCCKTGLTFTLNNCGQSGGKSPWSPSIDRRNPNKGYTKDNVQLVCLMYNFCKGVWSEEEVKQFVNAVRDYE